MTLALILYEAIDEMCVNYCFGEPFPVHMSRTLCN